eukprot:CAMPEP_0197038748 /NCGR_PEP_ID=MMETSP1384-20130603/15633_1 /TAXON_ID=29189 /ORGANISM="Ammonia sp." /LENGTH=33 /DNA_ID= /DNA_START= /DNA_END= /DNA_ORIENTATION=
MVSVCQALIGIRSEYFDEGTEVICAETSMENIE